MPSAPVRLLSWLLLAAPSAAQAEEPQPQPQPPQGAGTTKLPGGLFTSPGMPSWRSGQTSRFSSEFNPAIGGVVDFLGSWRDPENEDDGVDISLRTFELNLNAFIDPNVWGYAVVFADEDEVELEEAAVQYVGWNSNATLRAGRFFVDFGKQMQGHVDELPYVNRPAVLREYLGEELPGTGLQLDNWFAVGDETTVRYSIGIFQSLAGDHGHEDEEEAEEGPVIAGAEGLRDIDELSFTARLTGMRDVGENGILQLGLSGRFLPSFGFEDQESGIESDDDLSNIVWGLDATYGWQDDVGRRHWNLGAEYLLLDGDIGAEVDAGAGTLDVLDDRVSGYYAWSEYGWNPYHAVGLLYGSVEHPEPEMPKDTELALFYTWHLSELSRLRFQLERRESDEAGDETLFLVQFTNFIGAHAHGVNW